MRNIFRFGFWGIIKEYRDRFLYDDHPHSFVFPHHVSKLFAQWDIVETRGVGLDGTAQIALLSQGFARYLENLTRFTPFKYLTKELLIKVGKQP